MIIRLKNLYTKSPRLLQEAIRIVPFSYRMGPAYRRTLRLLLESDRWNRERYRVYQRQKLGQLLESAISHVPYYGRYRRLLGKDPFAILSDIEPVTKAQIQNDLDSFLLPPHLRRSYHVTYTGGSSGYPLKIWLNNDAAEVEWAFMIAQWMRAGYRPDDRRVTFRGVEFRSDKGPFIKENPVYNETLFSPFHLTDDKLALYVARIKEVKPRFLRGYPSALTVLARYIEGKEITDLPSITALLCGSEELASGQREYLQTVFRTRLYSWYGMTEKAVLAGECEKSDAYHCFPQYGITEIEDKNGNLSSQPGASGEIVGTGFLNRVMPFIRYKLQDYSTIVGDYCKECRRDHLLLGRVSGHYRQEMIVGKSGALISMAALNCHDDTFAGVRQFQFHQRERGKVVLYIRVGDGFSHERCAAIKASLARKTGIDVEYDIKIVNSIEGTPMGKGVHLRQELPIPSVED